MKALMNSVKISSLFIFFFVTTNPLISLTNQTNSSISTKEKLGVIKGKILANNSEIPLRKVILSLRTAQSRNREQPKTTRTNDSGEYEFKGIKPGKYVLRATRNGYIPQNYGQKPDNFLTQRIMSGTPLTVRADEILEGINFKLIRGGVVEGRVVAQDSEPLSRVRVLLSRYGSFQGQRRLLPIRTDQTDDRGQYRIFDVAPGSYYLSANLSSPFGRNSARPSFPSTYYPGVLNPQEAIKVEVLSGNEIGGYDITLIETLSYSVTGQILQSDGRPADSIRVSSTKDSGDSFFSMSRGTTNSDSQGNFEISNLMSGRYRLIARSRINDGIQTASKTVEITNQNLDGITLTLGNGAQISGKLFPKENLKDIDPRQIQIRMIPSISTRGMFGRSRATINEDFTFQIENILEGLYQFSVNLPPGNHYVKAIQSEGQDFSDTAFEVRNGDRIRNLEIQISSEGAELTGWVEKKESRERVEGATVLLFSKNSNFWKSPARFTKTTQTDQKGNFSVRGLIPGEYLLCALLDHEPGRESEFNYLKKLETEAKQLNLVPNKVLQTTIVVIPTPPSD